MNAPVPLPDQLMMIRRASVSLEPNSFNAESRTVTAVISTGAPVSRCDYQGQFDEALTISADAIDMSRAVGAPVLDNHNRSSAQSVIGTVEKVWTEGKRLLAVLKFSGRSAVADVLTDIADGVLRNVSIGYTVEKFEEAKGKGGLRTKTATRWTLREVSIVPIGADPGASIRSEPEMTTAPAPAAPAANETVVPPADDVQVQTRAEMNTEIRSIARVSGCNQTWIDGQMDAGATPEAARLAAFEAMRARSNDASAIRNTSASVGTDFNDAEFRARTIGEALWARTQPAHQLSEPARQYANMSMVDIARDCLRVRSLSVVGLSQAAIVTRALETTSDFPNILGDATGRSLRNAYQAAPSGLKRVSRQVNARDFKARYRIMFGEAPRLEKVNEHGEFKHGAIAEGAETYKLVTFGKIFGLTRQAIVNDDLNAFEAVPRKLGQAAASTEAQTLADLLQANNGNGPTMSDNNPLFHTSHKNKEATTLKNFNDATPTADALLGTGRLALRKQVGLSGSEFLTITPKFLIVPSEQETAAEKGLAIVAPTKTADFNPFSGKLELVVDPRLTSATRWYYIAADPDQVDGLEYAYLEGAPGPQITTRAGFDVDGVEIKVALDFGAGFVDWRSWYVNPGA